ncbi:MAG TPA: HK97 gp10 family phage protein [Nitrosopumilus sp.]|nr:HK97 gp10 family phage protein [Nitrosopumilus sp.]
MVEIDTTVFDRKLNKAMEEWGQMLMEEMIYRCPTEYGTMANSIDSKVTTLFSSKTGGEIETGTNGIPYASFIEYGTESIMRANDFNFPRIGSEHTEWKPVLDTWQALRDRGEVGSGQTMPFARSSSFFTEPDRLNYLKQVFK